MKEVDEVLTSPLLAIASLTVDPEQEKRLRKYVGGMFVDGSEREFTLFPCEASLGSFRCNKAMISSSDCPMKDISTVSLYCYDGRKAHVLHGMGVFSKGEPYCVHFFESFEQAAQYSKGSDAKRAKILKATPPDFLMCFRVNC